MSRVMARLSTILICLACSASLAKGAAAQSLVGNPALDVAAASMRPGQYLIDADRPVPGFSSAGLATQAPVTLAVSLAMQRLYVYRGNELIAVTTVSTGKPGKRTPAGDFTILQKQRWHRSNLYSNAPMPFMQRLTWTGIAIHAGQNPGFPASHGCIRIPPGFAPTLFELTALGETVSVDDWPPHTPVLLDVAWTDVTGAVIQNPALLDYDFRALRLGAGVRARR